MSFAAIQWALSQPVEKSPAKFVLVAMASCVNAEDAEMLCWPSVKFLSDTTRQDRKTVMDGLRRLRKSGFVVDTGERRGITGQVPVYRLKSAETGTVSNPQDGGALIDPVTAKSAETGTVPNTAPVPKTDGNSTEFPHQQYRISLETVPKTGHGTSKEQVKNKEGIRKRSSGFDASAIELPDWIERDTWCRWCRDRKARGKAITEEAARLQLGNLDKFRAQGFTPAEVIEHSIASSYQGLYPPKRSAQPTTSKHAGFAGKDYRQGVNNDGTFT